MVRPQNLEIEALVYSIVDRLRAGQPIEDARVELKAMWPTDHAKAARRIAGHVNAARESWIMWVVGVDEKSTDPVVGVIGDFGSWWPQVAKHFDELVPEVHDLVVPVDGRSVVTLVFDAGRAPLVVNNPQHGRVAGVLERDVPWREGTQVRSAHRSDLIRLLAPVAAMPDLGVIDCVLTHQIDTRRPDKATYSARINLYLSVPRDAGRLILPEHSARAEVNIAGDEVWLRDFAFYGPDYGSPRSRGPTPTPTIEAGWGQLIVDGSGPFVILATSWPGSGRAEHNSDAGAEIRLELGIEGLERRLNSSIDCLPRGGEVSGAMRTTTWVMPVC